MSKRVEVVCMLCGEPKTTHQLVKHRNDLLNEKSGFCKNCIKEHVDIENVGSVKEMLRLLNIPFVDSVWGNAVEKEQDNAFGKYLQLIATKKKFKNFMDSDFSNGEDSVGELEITEEMIARWGAGMAKDDYYVLEVSYKSLCKIKEPATTLEETRYVQNVMLKSTLDEALRSGDHKAITPLKKAYGTDLKELGLDVDALSKEDTRTLGTRIQEWERNAPIPEMSAEFEDVDGIKEYVNKYFVIPMKRVFGRATEEEVSTLYD